MSEVYIVSSGDYSNYSVRGVFSSMEKAERWMKTCGGSFNEVEEMELDEGYSEIDRGLALFSVRICKSGDVISVGSGGYPSLVKPIDCWTARETFYEGFKNREVIYEPKDHRATVYVWATDKAHAVKVANEKRIQALADPSVRTYPPHLNREGP